jgi:pre-mRNA-processing factor 6
MNALKANDNDSDLFVAIAKVFWVERKAEKVKKWLSNAITVDKDNGDAWAHMVRYEMEFGPGENDTLQDFKEAEPRHGEMWTRAVKKVENWRRDPCEVLKEVAKSIKLFEEI